LRETEWLCFRFPRFSGYIRKAYL